MRTIHKYALTGVVTRVSTFEGARFLHAAEQRGQVTVWAEVNTLEPERMRTLHIVPTGGEVPYPSLHVGSVLTDEGDYVWHVYAETTPRETDEMPEEGDQ